MPCRKCNERVKDWNGDDPRCAFDGEFTDNWRCATLDVLRESLSMFQDGGEKTPKEVHYVWCEDQNYAHVVAEALDRDFFRGCVWITWYKHRGATEQVWILEDENPPRRPNEDEVIRLAHVIEMAVKGEGQ